MFVCRVCARVRATRPIDTAMDLTVGTRPHRCADVLDDGARCEDVDISTKWTDSVWWEVVDPMIKVGSYGYAGKDVKASKFRWGQLARCNTYGKRPMYGACSVPPHMASVLRACVPVRPSGFAALYLHHLRAGQSHEILASARTLTSCCRNSTPSPLWESISMNTHRRASALASLSR